LRNYIFQKKYSFFNLDPQVESDGELDYFLKGVQKTCAKYIMSSTEKFKDRKLHPDERQTFLITRDNNFTVLVESKVDSELRIASGCLISMPKSYYVVTVAHW
jgi:hypothetical protein